MADRSFELQLDRLFAQAPVLPDAEAFADRVTTRLDRGWTFRRMLIGSLGLAGGVIGAAQVLGSGLLARLDAISARSDALVSTDLAGAFARTGLAHTPVAEGLSSLMGAGAGVNGQVLWMSAALAVLAVGLFVTRAIKEI